MKNDSRSWSERYLSSSRRFPVPNRKFSGDGTRKLCVWGGIAALVLCLLTGCHTYVVKVNKAREAFYCNNLDSATEQIVKEREKPSNAKSRDVLKLEEAMMRLCAGDFKQSETLLREVRDSFDQLENKKVKTAAEKAASMLADDCVLSYPGEDYEKVMIRVMLALNSLMMDGYDAKAYANQINLKQEEIIAKSPEDPKTKEKIKKSYKNLPIGPYLCGVLSENDVSGQQEQIHSFTKVTEWDPSFMGGREMLERAKNGTHSEKGNGVVYVFALVGHGPYKVEQNAEVTQAALLVADIIVSATSKHSIPPTITAVPIPFVMVAPCRYRAAKVTIDEADSVLTEPLTDVNSMAIEQFEANKPWVIARAVARRVVKKAGIYGVKEAVGTNSPEGELLLDLVGILWEGAEEADTRCWNLLPGSIQVARIELPAGEHDLKLAASTEGFSRAAYAPIGASRYLHSGITPPPPPGPHPHHGPGPEPFAPPPSPHAHRVWKNVLGSSGSNARSCGVHVRVEDGRNSYVLVYFGDYGLIGEPHVNTP